MQLTEKERIFFKETTEKFGLSFNINYEVITFFIEDLQLASFVNVSDAVIFMKGFLLGAEINCVSKYIKILKIQEI